MTIDTSKIRVSTKGMVGALVSMTSLFQIQAVHDFCIKQAHNHPHWLSFFGLLTGVGMLLHNPDVRECLGLGEEDEAATGDEGEQQ